MGGRALRIVSDEQLLMSGDPEDFGEFYRRHAREVLGYLARRTNDPEAAADLVAETFAAAILARARFRPGPTPATSWLYGIAAHKLADYQRRGRTETRACRRLRLERHPLTTADLDLIADAADEVAVQMIVDLPRSQREAVRAHVIDEHPYDELAAAMNTSEQVVRKRVSRGLSTLRARLEARR